MGAGVQRKASWGGMFLSMSFLGVFLCHFLSALLGWSKVRCLSKGWNVQVGQMHCSNKEGTLQGGRQLTEGTPEQPKIRDLAKGWA